MNRTIIVASHSKMADGLRDTLNFVSGEAANVIALSAYVDNTPVEDAIQKLMQQFSEEEELIILTDLAAGSVNQQFFAFRNRPHTHIISGVNLPLAFQFAMEPAEDYLSTEQVKSIIEDAKNEIKYMQDLVSDGDDEDE